MPPHTLKMSGSNSAETIWAGVPLPAWILDERLAAMERDQVALEILSAPTPVYARADDKTRGQPC
jgi:hypothetical protein